MRLSRYFLTTLREVPNEAEIPSHQLMLRAGMMRKVAAGVYTYMPLGWRVIHKVEQIVREEMDRAGALEVRLPILQPAELWQETGRWDEYGQEMFKLVDRHERLFCLGPTHEEIITDLVRNEVSSYRQLPVTLYQIQNKYRDEIRPRFGVMRSREFIMKDAYSFDQDVASMHQSYAAMYQAYERIFRRCGLTFRPVAADSGAIGGSYTHEFMALADSGEALVIFCPSCEYAANQEKAECQAIATSDLPMEGLRSMSTPGVHTIAGLVDFLGVGVQQTSKILFYQATYASEQAGAPADRELIAAVIRGDRQLNEVKLKNYLHALDVAMASQQEVLNRTGAPFGSAGPVGLAGARLLVDREVAAGRNWIVGANKEGYHLLGANPGRDFDGEIADLINVEAGDACPQCGAPLSARRGIEVGQVFELGTKYSQTLGAVYHDESVNEVAIQMGCYGIGVTRTAAAVIEQSHDERGIIWPVTVAPFHVVVIPVNNADPAQMTAAEAVYQELLSRGVEAVLDDRNERAGVKFADAELIGYPYRVTVGRALARGELELTARRDLQSEFLLRDTVASVVQQRIADSVAALTPNS